MFAIVNVGSPPGLEKIKAVMTSYGIEAGRGEAPLLRRALLKRNPTPTKPA